MSCPRLSYFFYSPSRSLTKLSLFSSLQTSNLLPLRDAHHSHSHPTLLSVASLSTRAHLLFLNHHSFLLLRSPSCRSLPTTPRNAVPPRSSSRSSQDREGREGEDRTSSSSDSRLPCRPETRRHPRLEWINRKSNYYGTNEPVELGTSSYSRPVARIKDRLLVRRGIELRIEQDEESADDELVVFFQHQQHYYLPSNSRSVSLLCYYYELSSSTNPSTFLLRLVDSNSLSTSLELLPLVEGFSWSLALLGRYLQLSERRLWQRRRRRNTIPRLGRRGTTARLQLQLHLELERNVTKEEPLRERRRGG